ncbi:MAG: cytochrome c3 family protein [Blastocatellia bacterium]|nr:cytochrome c3 family protein [Blastocatellia bacterium]
MITQKGKLLLVLALAFIAALGSASARRSHAQQKIEDPYKNNACVQCHAQLVEPLLVSGKHLEWQFSAHEAKGVGCEKCHGGDATTRDKKKAHAGILPSSNLESRLSMRNQPDTCGACHQNIIAEFAKSAHFKQLKGIGLGPSCGNCHGHMATQVVYEAAATADLCARCHDSINFMQPRPDIPVRARETMMALQRADWVLTWSHLLIADGQKRGVKLDAESNEVKQTQEILRDAQIKWHGFDLAGVRKRADEAYLKGSRVKEGLRKKLLSE